MENYIGFYAGIVTENKDPENAGRLLLQIPSIFGENISENWALPLGIVSGKNRGFIQIPKIGDNVWVCFDCGNLEYPIWTYGAFVKNTIPNLASDTTIIWQSEDEQNIIIDEKEHTIKITQKNKFIIELGPEGIEIKKENISFNKTLGNLLDWLKNVKTIPAAVGVTLSFLPTDIAELEVIKNDFSKVLKM